MTSLLVILAVVIFLFTNASIWACILLAGLADQEIERISRFQSPACHFHKAE
jgi:hypothetical protein